METIKVKDPFASLHLFPRQKLDAVANGAMLSARVDDSASFDV